MHTFVPSDHPMPARSITGLVLAGGQGRRMGSVDKGLVPLAGRPMVAHVLERLAPQVDDILINANQHAAEYAAFGHRVIAGCDRRLRRPARGTAGRARATRAMRWSRPCPAIRRSCPPTWWRGSRPR